MCKKEPMRDDAIYRATIRRPDGSEVLDFNILMADKSDTSTLTNLVKGSTKGICGCPKFCNGDYDTQKSAQTWVDHNESIMLELRARDQAASSWNVSTSHSAPAGIFPSSPSGGPIEADKRPVDKDIPGTTSLARALHESHQQYAARNPLSRIAHDTAAKHLPGGGTRTSIYIHPFPLFIEKGAGAKITDVDGHEYLDFVSDFTSGIFGKSHPVLMDAIKAALDNGLQLGAHTQRETDLASQLTSRFPSIDLVRFTNSGTEANILAISAALRYTKRKKVVVFQGGYHGSVLSHFHLGGSHDDDGDLKVPYEYVVCPYNNIQESRAIISEHSEDIGAIIVEPMLGAGGCIPGHPEFLQWLRGISTFIGSVLIFDEVQTARLSAGGRQQMLGITPDMTTLGKFFGGGFAFGAFGGKRDILKMFDARSPGAVSHGGTFNNSPLTMVAGSTAAKEILTEDALEELNGLGDRMRDSINSKLRADDLPFEMTGLGSINQLHSTLPSDQSKALDLLFFQLLEQGYWIAQRGLISLNFAMTVDDVDGFAKAVIKGANVVKDAM